jgi:flagellar L-ring protein precursor FlgH
MNMQILRRCRPAALTAAALALAACASAPEQTEGFRPPQVVQPVRETPSAGAIYQAGTDVRLFEDLKAARVGDILTVRLVERTNASVDSNTSTSKSTSASLANPTVLGRTITYGGVPLFDGSLEGETGFDGSGSSNQSNSLVGDITVTVVERLPNGNLRIRGEKELMLNQGKEYIQLTGIVRPTDIDQSNSVLSAKVADAQIAYSSRGVLAAANRQGFFARFFNSWFSGY